MSFRFPDFNEKVLSLWCLLERLTRLKKHVRLTDLKTSKNWSCLFGASPQEGVLCYEIGAVQFGFSQDSFDGSVVGGGGMCWVV